jgi:hypothetical protein
MTGREARKIFRLRQACGTVSFCLVVLGLLFTIPGFVNLISYGIRFPNADPPEPLLLLVIAPFAFAAVALIGMLVAALLMKQFPSHVFCPNPNCGKYIPTLEAWTCGRCDFANYYTIFYSFLNRCKRCKATPTGFKCSHCGQVLPLGDGEPDIHPAHAIQQPATSETSEQITAKREADKGRVQHGIELNKLLAEYARSITVRRHAEEQSQPWMKNTKSPREVLEEHHAKKRDNDLALQESMVKFKAAGEMTYKNDPEGLAEYLHWLETAWKEDAIKLLESV